VRGLLKGIAWVGGSLERIGKVNQFFPWERSISDFVRVWERATSTGGAHLLVAETYRLLKKKKLKARSRPQ